MTLRSISACLVSGAMLLGAGPALAQEPSERAAERLAQYQETGETRSCVSLSRVSSIVPLDDNHFLFEMRGGDVYLNRVSGGCNQASSSFTRIEYRVSGSQLCRNDIINVVDNSSGLWSGSCGLREFIGLERVPAEAEASR
ncbi:hypothetical protein [Glycocaulis sp.]